MSIPEDPRDDTRDNTRDDNTRDDGDLRALLHETAAQITPHGTFDDIKERTMKTGTRRWIAPTLAAAAAMALVVGGLGWMLRDNDSPTGSPSPGPATSPTGDATGAPLVQRAVPVYYAGQAARGTRLYREFQRREVCETDGCLATASITAALTGPAEDPDYRTLWPQGATVHAVEAGADQIRIDLRGDLHDRPAGMSAADAELAVQQLVYSAQAGFGNGRVPVQLVLDGKHTDTVLGVPASEPLAAASELDVLAPVQVSAPADGQTVKAGAVKVEGVAATFEANVVWEILVGGDAVVASGHTTAAECCRLAPYSFTVDLEPGAYTLVVHDTDESGEGLPVNQDTKEIIVE